jgi:hypothetical protein
MARYSPGPEGLIQLAADLGAPDPARHAQAAQALMKESRLRDAVSLVMISLQVADEAILAGRFDGDRPQLEALRPIGTVLSRLGDLAASPDQHVRGAAASALKLFDQNAAPDRGAA